MKELAYGASHEINNPLANIALRAQSLLKEEEDPSKRKKLEAIHRQSMRAHEMISDLMLFARPPELRIEPTDIGELVRGVIDQLSPLANENDIKIEWVEDSSHTIAADPIQMGVAIKAVVQNSIDAIGEDGWIRIGTSSSDSKKVVLTILDNGPGVAPEVAPHVFDPFFSGREAGRGLGFGLSKCWRIVTDHGGEVKLKNHPLGGVEVSITLATQ